MNQHTLYFNDFEALVLRDALEREWKLLDIVTAKEREAGKRDGWALARIKVQAVRALLSQTVRGLPWTTGEGHRLTPEDEADLAERVAAVGQKMRPPRSEVEKLTSLKARRRAAVRKIASSNAAKPSPETSAASSAKVGPASPKPNWAPPSYE